MSAEEVLKLNESKVLKGEIISHVTGKKTKVKGKKLGAFSATAFVTVMILVFVVLFSSGNLIPSAISERLVEETDVQYADAVESKILVFQQALSQGEVPNNTATKLKDAGVLVGYVSNGEFIESNSEKNLSVKIDDKIIPAENFATEVHSNTKLYNAFNNATYSRAAYYYDDSAKEVFKKIGTSRNNYNGSASFDETMDKLVGKGSSINVDSVVLVEKQDEDGKKYYDHETFGGGVADSKAENFVAEVAQKNTAISSNKATLNTATTLNTADKISQEQKSSLLFLAFMENISKMKAGEGNDSRINEAMNYLYDEKEESIVDVNTGEILTITGSMMESPSLYAVLSGEKLDINETKNYSSDRVLKTVENQLNVENSDGALNGTITSTSSKIKGSIGRFLENGSNGASTETLSVVTPTIKSSLVDNSFDKIGGIAGGEMLVEGAVNVGKSLAKASGATAGSAESVKSYAKLTTSILAMDAKVDKMNRSPFDITSKNTFLGSIIYKMAVGLSRSGPIIKQLSSLSRVATKSIAAILPTTHADDENLTYLTNFGNCETLGSIGAVGSTTCATVATFDTSTLNNTFNDAGFIDFVEANTELKNGVRTVKSDSDLADFIVFNNERLTPDGVVDGGILKSINDSPSSVPFVSDILSMIKIWLGASERDKFIASGAAFVNTESNYNWETYKYAQRYVSLARATSVLKQYDGEKTAYNNIEFFEGEENPVLAFLNEYYDIANK